VLVGGGWSGVVWCKLGVCGNTPLAAAAAAAAAVAAAAVPPPPLDKAKDFVARGEIALVRLLLLRGEGLGGGTGRDSDDSGLLLLRRSRFGVVTLIVAAPLPLLLRNGVVVVNVVAAGFLVDDTLRLAAPGGRGNCKRGRRTAGVVAAVDNVDIVDTPFPLVFAR
jgi:hypothetical protein